MIIYPLKSKLIKPGDSVLSVLTEALAKNKLRIMAGDVLAVSSKVVAVSEGKMRNLTSVKPTIRARNLARRYSLSPAFVQVVLEEANDVLGGVKGALLAIKDGDATANAGVDRKNAPGSSVVLWPDDPDSSARALRASLYRSSGQKVGVVIVDSRVTPLRLGTIGLAIGCAGFHPLRDFRGSPDLYGRRAEITLHAIADGVAAAAHLVMGEAQERIPFVLVRGAPVDFGSGYKIESAKLPAEYCLYMSQTYRKTRKSTSLS